ncbi:MAG: hypothetical protein J5922_04705 [Clostridia bacterium]|nr:hypothetical protein [Clostridia bacterium]
MQKLKKLFGGISLSWRKIIIFALASGIYTALAAIIPQLKETSFHAIAVTFEVWIFFGIIIIMNSKSNIDSALKCFVFFLISQPLVYLLQAPISSLGWDLFGYYKYWFVWTVFCLPMGYIGYYIKKDKWWGYLILLPMIALTASSYYEYLSYFTFCYPYYLLISVFCAAAMLIYPNVLFNSKKIKITGTLISTVLITVITVFVFLNPFRYSADILSTIDGEDITKDCRAALADEKYGDVSVEYVESIDAYMVHGDFKKKGKTELIIETPNGATKIYDLIIQMRSYDITENQSESSD